MISVILNVYKRPYSLEEQITAILNQSVKVNPEDIHVWYNYSGIEQSLPKDKEIKTYQCNWNTKFHGRFTIPLLCKTPYIAMFDDDVIPGKDWFKNCIETIEKCNGILGTSGVILKGKAYRPNQKYGWTGINNNDTVRVDLIGHNFFFKQEWTKYLWYEKQNFDNGEDIQLSYLCQKYGNINTFVPPHPRNNVELWGNVPGRDKNWGMDRNASYIVNRDHYMLRDKICIDCINNGWKTVYNIK